MTQIRVGVLRGGKGRRYEESLQEGLYVLRNMPKEFTPVDILVDREGKWHISGYEIEPANIAHCVDVLYSALLDEVDEEIEDVVPHVGLPYVGSSRVAHAVANDRVRSHDVFRRAGLKVPSRVLFDTREHTGDDVFSIFRSTPQPSVVRTRNRTARHKKTHAPSYNSLMDALEQTSALDPQLIIEADISGREVVCIVLDGYRGEGQYTLPVVEIRDEAAVYPAQISREDADAVAEAARKVHGILGAHTFSQTHAIVSSRGVYILDTVLSPEHADNKPLHIAGDAVGLTRAEFLKYMVERVLK